MHLDGKQQYAIVNALFVARDKFCENARQFRGFSEAAEAADMKGAAKNYEHLADQFDKQSNEAHYLAKAIEEADRIDLEEFPYRVLDGDGDVTGRYETLDEARGAVRYDKMLAYSIWEGDIRREHCEGYTGTDDRAKQGLGLPNASEVQE